LLRGYGWGRRAVTEHKRQAGRSHGNLLCEGEELAVRDHKKGIVANVLQGGASGPQLLCYPLTEKEGKAEGGGQPGFGVELKIDRGSSCSTELIQNIHEMLYFYYYSIGGGREGGTFFQSEEKEAWEARE